MGKGKKRRRMALNRLRAEKHRLSRGRQVRRHLEEHQLERLIDLAIQGFFFRRIFQDISLPSAD